MECNLCAYVQRLKTTTGSNRTCWPATESREGCSRKMAWQQRTGGTGALIFYCVQQRKGLLLRGEAGTNRGREIRSPDVYSVYRVSEGFGNKIEISHTINSDTGARNPHLLKTKFVLRDLKQNYISWTESPRSSPVPVNLRGGFCRAKSQSLPSTGMQLSKCLGPS